MSMVKKIVDAATKATVLKRKVTALNKELEECKDIIRPWAIEEYATARQGNSELTMLEVPTTEGTLSVVFPKDKPDFIKGANPEAMLVEMPPVRSNLIAMPKREVVIVKEFYENWVTEGTFTKTERKFISRFIEFKEQTPRIEPAK